MDPSIFADWAEVSLLASVHSSVSLGEQELVPQYLAIRQFILTNTTERHRGLRMEMGIYKLQCQAREREAAWSTFAAFGPYS